MWELNIKKNKKFKIDHHFRHKKRSVEFLKKKKILIVEKLFNLNTEQLILIKFVPSFKYSNLSRCCFHRVFYRR